MKLLLIGAGGQVGQDLRQPLAEFGRVWAPTRAELDLEQPQGLAAAIDAWRPAIIVNAAAYTAVDRAETEPARAALVNAEAPGQLAAIAARSGALLVHYSTDYVFDGTREGAYEEDDPTGPLNVYGRTKLAGEHAIRGSGATHLILRTSGVFSPHGQNFVNTIVRLARERESLTVVDDQIGAPTWSADLARTTVAMLRRLAAAGTEATRNLAGTYHVSSAGEVSWCGVAREIVRAHPALAQRRHVAIEAIPSSAYVTLARRPANSLLSNARLERNFGIRMPHWEEALHASMAQG